MKEDLGATLLALGSAGALGLSGLLPEGAVGEFVTGFAGVLAGAAVLLVTMRERMRTLVESDRDLWTAVSELRRADMDHVRDFHNPR